MSKSVSYALHRVFCTRPVPSEVLLVAYLSVTQPWHGLPQPCVFGLGARGSLLEFGCNIAVARCVVV